MSMLLKGHAVSPCLPAHGVRPISQNSLPMQGEEASPLANWVQLENGCICCSVKNDMVKALEALLQQRASFDYILIETTGVLRFQKLMVCRFWQPEIVDIADPLQAAPSSPLFLILPTPIDPIPTTALQAWPTQARWQLHYGRMPSWRQGYAWMRWSPWSTPATYAASWQIPRGRVLRCARRPLR